MNNVKTLSIILLLSIGVASFAHAAGSCNTNCNTSCDTSKDCNKGCDDECRTSTYFVPRSITTDLTYRNNLTYYERYHNNSCNFFTWDSTLLYQRNSNGDGELGAGFLGGNPILVAEQGTGVDVNSFNLGLGVIDTNNPTNTEVFFSEEYGLCPRREVFAWLPQMFFNLDCFCAGTWLDISFAVARAKHELRQSFGQEQSNLDDVKNVAQALDARNTYWADCDTHTGVDNLLIRLGYDWRYCANDHIGFYFAGLAPTGKSDFANDPAWFPPVVGGKHGAVGFGLQGDYTIYECDADSTEFLFQTEFLYLFYLKHDARRRFDLKNGTLSRYLLVAPESNPNAPSDQLLDLLTKCVEVEPRHNIQWWANFHYQWCNWAAEFSYNLWWRDREHIDCAPCDFGELGIYSQRCPTRTSNSKAEISTLFNSTGEQDDTFTRLNIEDVDFCSGAAQRVLTHKIGGAVAYNTVWCDCYPMYVGFGAGYEFASDKHKRHALENWHVYGKWDIAF